LHQALEDVGGRELDDGQVAHGVAAFLAERLNCRLDQDDLARLLRELLDGVADDVA